MPAQQLFGSPEAAVPVAVALLVLGLLGPCLCLRACIWWRSPSRSQRKHTAWFGDSLLQEMLDGRNIMEHLTVYGKEHAVEGTVIMLPGAAAPRGTLAPVASLVAERFRVICVDLPGQGSLSAVPYSLARCEMVLTLVVRRSQQSHPGRRVVIAAQGAAAYVACHFALRPASERLTAGLVVMGRVPDYVGVARCSCSHDAVYSLAWAAVFANRALKARVAASDWDPEHRRAASRSDFNMAVIPEMRSELQGRPLLHRLREFKRTVVFLGPRAWVEEAEELIPVRRVHARRVRGARDDTLPPVDGASVDAMATEVVEVRGAPGGAVLLALPCQKAMARSWCLLSAPRVVPQPLKPWCVTGDSLRPSLRSTHRSSQTRTGPWRTLLGTTCPSRFHGRRLAVPSLPVEAAEAWHRGAKAAPGRLLREHVRRQT